MDYEIMSELGDRNYNADHILVKPEEGLFILADGAGNKPKAKKASREAAAFAYDAFSQNNKLPVARVLSAIKESNRIYETVPHVVSTIDLLYLKDDKAYLGHLGDARVIQVREGKVTQLTQEHRDETGVLQKFAGDISVHPDVTIHPIEKGDLFVMMTDGVHGDLDENELTKIFTSDASLEKMLEEIGLQAKMNMDSLTTGPQDNYSLILVRC
jgi:protein phosphatase